MADVNHVVLVGRLTRDAELKYTPSGFPISTFSIALNRRRKNGEQWVDESHFFDVELFGKSAESLKAYLVKGKQIAIEGELRQDRWEQDGQKRSKVLIAANNIQLLGGGGGGSGSGGEWPTPSGGASSPEPGGSYPSSNKRGVAGPPPSASSGAGSSGDDFPEDIPF